MPRARCHCLFLLLLSLFLLGAGAWGQEALESAPRLVVPNGTPVRLQMIQTISSAHAHKGDRLDFVVVKDVKVEGFTVIPAGTIARGSVAGVKGKRFFGIGGNVVVQLESVELITGDEAKLQARKEVKGKSRTRLMVVKMIATGLFYLPAAPVFLLSRGRDSIVLKGTEVTAFMNDVSPLLVAKLSSGTESTSELRQMIEFLPPHTVDGQGRDGDMLNLIFIAKEDDLQAAFERGGWLKTDRSVPAIVWRLLWQRKRYTKLPMSTLYVFGRPQTYSYAMPDPTAIVTRRHHLRIWRTHYEMDGSPVWVAAATHDVAIEIELKKLRIGHRIDPEVDLERDFIADNLADTTLVANREYVHGTNPVFKGQTATGGSYYSDSRMLLLSVRPRLPGDSEVARSGAAFERRTGSNALLIGAAEEAQ